MKYLVSVWLDDIVVEANSEKEAEDKAAQEIDAAVEHLGIRVDYAQVAKP